jgi:hypothetical protein
MAEKYHYTRSEMRKLLINTPGVDFEEADRILEGIELLSFVGLKGVAKVLSIISKGK